MASSTEKELLRFKFDEKLLRELESVRADAFAAGGIQNVTPL